MENTLIENTLAEKANNFIDKDRLYFEDLFSFRNLYNAHMVSRRCKRHKDNVVIYENDLSTNLFNLQKEIYSGEYSIRKYNKFYVYEPKKRLIQSCGYVHRVAQHCLCDNYLTPLIDSKLIYDNCACRKNKGVDFCVKRAIKFMREHYIAHGNTGYCLRVDVSKYFASIDKNILLGKLSKVVHNRYIVQMISNVVNDYPSTGLPIGNQTSQIFAVFYLNDLDRICKEKLGIKHYIRYMDDILIFHKDKKVLTNTLNTIKEQLTKDGLKINPKTCIVPIQGGVDFIGRNFSFNSNGGVFVKLRAANKRRVKRKLKLIHSLINNKVIAYDKYRNILASYWGLLKRGGLRRSFYEYFMIDNSKL